MFLSGDPGASFVGISTINRFGEPFKMKPKKILEAKKERQSLIDDG